MKSLILKVVAFYGDPHCVGTTYLRSGTSIERIIPAKNVVNDPNNDVIKDLNYAASIAANDSEKRSDYGIDQLLADFEDEYECKVALEEPTSETKKNFFEFNVFEPSWPNEEEASDVINDLTRRLVDWVHGYPSGA